VKGTGTAQAITLLALPIITRLFSNEELGVFYLFSSYVGALLAVVAFRYDSAIHIAPSREEAFKLAIFCAAPIGLSSTAGAVLLAVLSSSGVFGFDVLGPMALLVIPLLLIAGIAAVVRGLLLREEQTSLIAKIVLVKSFANSSGKIAAGIFSTGPVGLIVSEIIAVSVSLTMLGTGIWKKLCSSLSRLSAKESRLCASKYRRYPAYELPSALIDAAAMAFPMFALNALYGPEWAGIFGLAWRVASLPNTHLGAAIADVFQMSAGRLVRDKQEIVLKRMFYSLIIRLILVGLIPLAILRYGAEWLFPVIFGDEWRESGRVAAVISPWMFAAFVVSSLSRVLSVIQRQQLKLVYDGFALLSMYGAYLIASQTGLDVMTTICIIVALQVCGFLVYLAMMIRGIDAFIREKA
jgi:O-antigen/teichoic acid export membrane protein